MLAAIGASSGCTSPDSNALFGLRPAPDTNGDVSSSGAGAEPNGGRGEPAGASGGSPNDRDEGQATGGLSGGVAGGGQTSDAADAGSLEPPAFDDRADAGVQAPDAVAPSPAPECDGQALQGVCWYLGDDSQTCDGVCATHGGFSDATSALLGTPEQGGSLESCVAVLQVLDTGVSTVREGFRGDGLGLGCHVFINAAGAVTDAWWLTAPALASAASGIRVSRACGCAR